MKRGWLLFIMLAVMLVLTGIGIWSYLARDAIPRPVQDGSGLQQVGLILSEDENVVMVLAVMEDSPAAQCGLRPGDRICILAGSPVQRISQVESLLPAGIRELQTELIIERDGQELVLPLHAALRN